jgi:hypothetical protein
MDSSRQATICIAIAYDRYNILLNTRSAWNCATMYNPLIYKALPAMRSTVYQFIPLLWAEYQGFMQISCLDVCLLTYRNNREKACARWCKTEDAKSQPLRTGQIMGQEGLNGSPKRSAHQRDRRSSIFSALPNMVARSSPAT